MHRYLVVAHRTLGGTHLLDEVRKRQAAGPCTFHILVPVTHPTTHTWSEGEVEAQARAQLAAAIDRFHDLGITDVAGEIGDVNPVAAVQLLLLRGAQFDEIIVSTLPPGMSRWLKRDVPSRLRKESSVPVTHVVAESEPATH